MAKVRTPPIYTTPADVALAFYQAFEASDIDAMMATWAEDEEIVCVHPGGPRLVGYDAVRTGWEQLFAGDDTPCVPPGPGRDDRDGRPRDAERGRAHHGGAATARRAALRSATNVFLRTPSGWRMVMHHASPAPAIPNPEAKGPLH